jgi:hypothetical protein
MSEQSTQQRQQRQQQHNMRGIPTELESVFSALKFETPKYKILADSNVEDVALRLDEKIPAVGSTWRGSVDERSYRVVAIASDREVHGSHGSHGMATFTNHSGFDGAQVEQMKTRAHIQARTKVVFQEAVSGEVFMLRPSEFFSDVDVYFPNEHAPVRSPRFVEEKNPKEWRFWFPVYQKFQNLKRKFYVQPWSFDHVKADLASSSTKSLYVINSMITQHGMADLIFLAYPQAGVDVDTSNPRSLPPTIVKIPATWYPFDLTTLVTRSQLRSNSSFLNFLAKGHLTVISPWRARQFMLTSAAMAEKKRIADRNERIRVEGGARKL